MDGANADQWVVISAMLVGGVYAYRRMTEEVASAATLNGVLGIGNPVPLGAFVTAWGFTFLVVSILAAGSPELGKAFALLIATGDLLVNGKEISDTVSKKVATTSTSTKKTTK